MAISPLAGKPAPQSLRVDLAHLERDYYERTPDRVDPGQRVSFGTSGHRGTSLNGTFTEAHILAITQAICDYRRCQGTDGPLQLGKDTHALSGTAQRAISILFQDPEVHAMLFGGVGIFPGSPHFLGNRDWPKMSKDLPPLGF